MIVAWMLYATLVGALLYGAGLVLENAPAAFGRQRRWVWVGTIAASVALPLAAALAHSRFAAAPRVLPPEAAGFVRQTMAPIVAAGTTAQTLTRTLDAIAIGGWMAASLGLALMLLRSRRSLNRARRAWPTATGRELGLGERFVAELTAGAPVRITDGQGPAVAGVFRSEILVPRWCLDLPAAERALILAHEAEHLRGRDTRLLALGRCASICLPWMLPLWWQVRRLRLAVELDCDRRVIRRGFDQPRYGRLLLHVGSRRSTVRDQSRAIAALAAPSSQLEKRIRAMFDTNPRGRWMRATAALIVATGLVVVACESPTPFEADEAAELETASTIKAMVLEPPVDESHVALERRFGPDDGAQKAVPGEVAKATLHKMRELEASLAPLDRSAGELERSRLRRVPETAAFGEQAEELALRLKAESEANFRLRQVATEESAAGALAPAKYELREAGPNE